MKKTFLIFFVFIISSAIHPQSPKDDLYLLTNTQNTFGISSIKITDPYLSPLQYNGLNLQFDNENLRFLNTGNLNLSKANKLSINGGLALNPASTSLMILAGLNFKFGYNYHIRPINKLTILTGINWDADVALKYVSRNSNNPVATDISTNLNISGKAFYNINLVKRDATIELTVQSPIVGCMFVPRIGSSYYELFLLGNLNDAIHFSSIHNKRGIDSKFVIHIPFNNNNWHFGFGYKALKYSANETVYKNENFSLLVGTSFDIITFAGRKNKAPENFINIYK